MLGLVWIVRAATTVNLGTADNFAVLGGSTVTNTGPSTITGDLGVSPGGAVVGFPPGTVSGTQHPADATASQAQTDLTAAYNNAAGQASNANLSGQDLGGMTLTPGTYTFSSSAQLTGTLTLNAQGDPAAVFIFQIGSTLTTASSSKVVLANDAQACHVFWQVGSSATLGTSTDFKGNILALTSITLTTSANIEGRALARNGAVTLDTNIITEAICAAVPPLINVTKVPTPLLLPAGGGSVTYNYTVTNIGTAIMSNVTVTDNKCASVGFVSGDTNSDSKLDTTETWHYSCTTILSQTTTNTVTATGEANGLTATDTANATIVVGASLTPSLIHLIKRPNVFLLPAGGGTITYTYTVTNPGTVALSDVSVVDDKCASVGFVSGDTNSNNLLEASETWTYTCQSNLTRSTTNTGTAEGSANDLTATDSSSATVIVSASAVVATPAVIVSASAVVATPAVIAPASTVVATPSLPETGIRPPNKSSTLWNIWNIIIPTGISATLFLFYLARKKRTI